MNIIYRKPFIAGRNRLCKLSIDVVAVVGGNSFQPRGFIGTLPPRYSQYVGELAYR